MPDYTNPGYAAVTHIDAYLKQREADRLKHILEDRQAARDALDAHREERIAAGEIDDREMRKKDMQAAQEEKNYKRALDKAHSFLKGAIPSDADVAEMKKYGVYDSNIQPGAPGGAMPDTGSPDAPQGPVNQTPDTMLGTPQQRLQDANRSDAEARATDIANAISNAKTPEEATNIVMSHGGTIAEAKTLIEMHFPKSVMNIDPRRNTVTKIGELPPNSQVANESYPTTPGGGAGRLPIDPEKVSRAAQAVLSHQASPSQSVSLFGGMGQDSAAFKREMNLEILKENPSFNFQEAESNYQFGKSIGTQNTVRYIDNIADTVPVIKRTSEEFKRTGVKFINRAELVAKAQAGDVKAQNFNFAMTFLADEIAKILQGGSQGSGTSDAKLKQAQAILGTDMTVEQLDGVLATADEMLANRRKNLVKGTYMDKSTPSSGEDKPSAADLIKKYSK